MSSCEHNDLEDDSKTLIESFIKAEEVIEEIENGRHSVDLQKRIKTAINTLEMLARNVSVLDLFSDNEEVDDLSTSSLRFLLISCYLGVAHHNIVTEPSQREEQLRLAKAYYHDFLLRLQCYGLNTERFISKQNEASCSDESKSDVKKYTSEEIREHKITRFRKQKELKTVIDQLKNEQQMNKMDESVQRRLYLTVLKYWSNKVVEELESIEEELPLVEMMRNRLQTRDVEKDTSTNSLFFHDEKPTTLKPFILTRSAQQKSVFGLGYPSIPTMTVDEWYNQRFGDTFSQQKHGKTEYSKGDSGDEGSSEDEHEENDEQTRAQLMKWDEYKDYHRRGWGNTHNKG